MSILQKRKCVSADLMRSSAPSSVCAAYSGRQRTSTIDAGGSAVGITRDGGAQGSDCSDHERAYESAWNRSEGWKRRGSTVSSACQKTNYLSKIYASQKAGTTHAAGSWSGGATYIVAEGPQGLYLVDQHAAHERVLYEQFMAEREENAIASQEMLEAVSVELLPEQISLIEANRAELEFAGFQSGTIWTQHSSFASSTCAGIWR